MRTQILWAGLFLAGGGVALGQEGSPARTTAPAEQPGTAEAKTAPEEQAIRAVDEAFVGNKQGAAKALAARFTEDAEVFEADGLRYRGPPLIEERLAETFAASPGAKMAIETESIRLLSPDVAKEVGRPWSRLPRAVRRPAAIPHSLSNETATG